MHKSRSGFTLVELLIVIVVIAILAAITIVAYNGIQSRARTAAIYSDMNHFAKAASLFNVANGHYPQGFEDLEALNISASKSAYVTSGTFDDNFAYCVKNADSPDAQVMMGGLSVDMKPYYVYNKEGFTPKIYTGPLSSSMQIGDICAEVFGVAPDFTALGLYNSEWQPWTMN